MNDLVYHPEGVEPPPIVVGASLWLDDIRIPPKGWDWVKTVPQAIEALCSKVYAVASLDHDLGLAEGWDGQEGYKLIHWMIEQGIWPTEACYVHSWNPAGAERMCSDINRYGPYEKLVRPTPAQTMPCIDWDDYDYQPQ